MSPTRWDGERWRPMRSCPVCATVVYADVPRCSWCTVVLASGSWRGCDPVLAARALRRCAPSKFEAVPSACGELRGSEGGATRHYRAGEEACDECAAARRAIAAARKREQRAAA